MRLLSPTSASGSGHKQNTMNLKARGTEMQSHEGRSCGILLQALSGTRSTFILPKVQQMLINFRIREFLINLTKLHLQCRFSSHSQIGETKGNQMQFRVLQSL